METSENHSTSLNRCILQYVVHIKRISNRSPCLSTAGPSARDLMPRNLMPMNLMPGSKAPDGQF